MPEDPKVEQQEVLHENNPYFYLGSPATQPPVRSTSLFLYLRYWIVRILPILQRLIRGVGYYMMKGIQFLFNSILKQIGMQR